MRTIFNTREHFSLLGTNRVNFSVDNPWFAGDCVIQTFELDELLATKLRALFQRRKGRDLFDLWLCLNEGLLNTERLVKCFLVYMEREGHPLTRAQFEQNLHEKANDKAFLDDVLPLLRPGFHYDADEALKTVCQSLVDIIPGDPWRGHEEA